MRWITGEYDRLYGQVKEDGKYIVLYFDRTITLESGASHVFRTLAEVGADLKIYSPGKVYGNPNDSAYAGIEEERFIQMCQYLNVQWLDESIIV